METIYNDVLDTYFKNYLLEKIQFLSNGKILKEGKLVSYKQDIYNVCFVLNTKKEDNDEFYLSIPFQIESCNDEKLIYFDYRLKTFCKNNEEMFSLLTEFISKHEPNDCLDKIIEIKLG
jgi:hypothetical protein